MPSVKAFMDNTRILSSKESNIHKILSLIDKQIIWCRMKKSRSLLLRKGKVTQNINFKVGGQRISTVSEEQAKSVGQWFDESLKDSNQAKEISGTLQKGCLNFWDEAWWFLSLGVSDYCLHYCYFHNISANMSSSLLQVFVELWNLHGTSNYVHYWIHEGRLFWFR